MLGITLTNYIIKQYVQTYGAAPNPETQCMKISSSCGMQTSGACSRSASSSKMSRMSRTPYVSKSPIYKHRYSKTTDSPIPNPRDRPLLHFTLQGLLIEVKVQETTSPYMEPTHQIQINTANFLQVSTHTCSMLIHSQFIENS